MAHQGAQGEEVVLRRVSGHALVDVAAGANRAVCRKQVVEFRTEGLILVHLSGPSSAVLAAILPTGGSVSLSAKTMRFAHESGCHTSASSWSRGTWPRGARSTPPGCWKGAVLTRRTFLGVYWPKAGHNHK